MEHQILFYLLIDILYVVVKLCFMCLCHSSPDVSLRGHLAWQTELWASNALLDSFSCFLRHERPLVSERAQYVRPVGGVRLRGHDSELRRPLSRVGAADRRTRSRRRSIGMRPFPAGEEEEELGVEPVLRPGGVHRR